MLNLILMACFSGVFGPECRENVLTTFVKLFADFHLLYFTFHLQARGAHPSFKGREIVWASLSYCPVMWSETVGLRTRPVCDQKHRSWSWSCRSGFCVMKHGLVTLVIIMILKDTTTFQVLFIVSLFWSWNITTVEINSGVHFLKS